MMRRIAALKDLIRGTVLLTRSALQEIFDESAYARFLLRRRLQTSAESYTEFLRENERMRQRRPRCC